jgi:hypothetical protein
LTTGAYLQLCFVVLVCERFGHAGGHRVKGELCDGQSGRDEHPDGVDAEGEHVEVPVAAEQGQQWTYTERMADVYVFPERQRNSQCLDEVGFEKESQTIGLVPPDWRSVASCRAGPKSTSISPADRSCSSRSTSCAARTSSAW